MYIIYLTLFLLLFALSEYISRYNYKNARDKMVGFTCSALFFLASMIFAVKYIVESGLLKYLRG